MDVLFMKFNAILTVTFALIIVHSHILSSGLKLSRHTEWFQTLIWQVGILMDLWLFIFLHQLYFSYRYQIPEGWPYQEARQLFKEPVVLADEEQLDIKWNAPDEEVNHFFWTHILLSVSSSCVWNGFHFVFFSGVDYFSGEWKWVQQWQGDEGIISNHWHKDLHADFPWCYGCYLRNMMHYLFVLISVIITGNRKN